MLMQYAMEMENPSLYLGVKILFKIYSMCDSFH